jgi:diguanylate cyclase (GGDEF)-like protein/PAS domain S-box-containing protein
MLNRLLRTGKKSGSTQDEDFYRTIAEQVADVILQVGPDGKVRFASPSVTTLLGISPESMIGRDALSTVCEEDLAMVQAAVARLASGEVSQVRTQARSRHADGHCLWVETTAKANSTNDGSAVVVLRDITDRKRLEEELAALALQDGLTGLANRRSFDQTLEREWQRTVREKTEMSLLLIDVDHFKRFNDEYGHQAGDDCLRSVAHAIRSALRRPGDVACRYGGEEIAVILGETGRDGAADTAERVRSAIAALNIPHRHNSAAPVVTASIGLAAALAREGGTSRMPEGLLQAADHALYRAKNDGRNRVAESLLLIPPQPE